MLHQGERRPLPRSLLRVLRGSILPPAYGPIVSRHRPHTLYSLRTIGRAHTAVIQHAAADGRTRAAYGNAHAAIIGQAQASRRTAAHAIIYPVAASIR